MTEDRDGLRGPSAGGVLGCVFRDLSQIVLQLRTFQQLLAPPCKGQRLFFTHKALHACDLAWATMLAPLLLLELTRDAPTSPAHTALWKANRYVMVYVFYLRMCFSADSPSPGRLGSSGRGSGLQSLLTAVAPGLGAVQSGSVSPEVFRQPCLAPGKLVLTMAVTFLSYPRPCHLATSFAAL